MRRFLNPFTTSCGQRPPHFAGRLEEKNRYGVSLDDMINKKPRNLAFVGEYGIGKTTLLFEFSKETQLRNCMSIFLPCRRFASEISFYNFLIQSVGQAIHKSKWKTFHQRLSSVGFSVFGSGVTLQLKESPADPIWGLVAVFEEAYRIIDKPLSILMDDFHDLVETSDEALQTLKQAFTVLVSLKNLPMMLVASTSIETFKGLKEPYYPIARFFEPRKLPPLSYQDVNKAINVPLEAYNLKFNNDAVDMIYKMSEGRPYYVQLCAYYALEQASSRTILKEDVQKGLKSAIGHLAIEKHDRQFDNAPQTEKTILMIIAGREPIAHKEIIVECKSSGMKESTAKMAISRLLEKKYIKKDDSEYYISERMFGEFLKTKKA